MELAATREDGQTGYSHSLRLTVNGPPANTSQTTPEEGIAFVTPFYVSYADDTPLNYSLDVNNSSDALQTLTSPVFQPFTLESGSEADYFWVNVIVTITDSFGAHLTVKLAVLVSQPQTTEQTTENDATTLGDLVTTVGAHEVATSDDLVTAINESDVIPTDDVVTNVCDLVTVCLLAKLTSELCVTFYRLSLIL